MQVNLRKAKAIQDSIKAAMNGVTLATTTEISVFKDKEDVDGIVSEAVSVFEQNFEKRIRLENILFDIRKSVGEANASCGISSLLTEDAHLNRLIRQYDAVLQNRQEADNRAAKRQLLSLQKQQESSDYYSRRDSFNTPILSDEVYKGFEEKRLEAKRRLTSIREEILGINVGQKIDIEDADWSFLQSEGII